MQVRIPGCSAEAFRRFLKWVYTDELEVDAETVVDVLMQADCYCLPVLRAQCVKAAVQLVCMANISEMVFAAERVHEEAGALQCACREFVLENLDKLEGTPACNRLMDDKDFVMRMFKGYQASERERKRRRTM